MIYLDRPELVLPPVDVSLNFFIGPFNILFIFKIFTPGTPIAYEFTLSFQNLLEHQLAVL